MAFVLLHFFLVLFVTQGTRGSGVVPTQAEALVRGGLERELVLQWGPFFFVSVTCVKITGAT